LEGVQGIEEKTVRIFKKEPLVQKQKVEKPGEKSIKTKEIPVNVERWLKDNVNKGYSPEEMKESLKKGGYDPSFVDIFLSKK
jgi:hypothetical protein